MRNCVILPFLLLVSLCASCRSASWVTHNDPLGFSVQTPPGWQVAGDRSSGRVTVSGPARQQAIIWPVFLPGAVDARSAPAILRRLVAAAGVSAAWSPAPATSANVVRITGIAAGRTAAASFAWIDSPKGSAGYLYVTAAPAASGTLNTCTATWRHGPSRLKRSRFSHTC